VVRAHALVLLLACSKPTVPVRPDFSSWDMLANHAAWQGAFVIDNGREAISITGDRVLNWDGTKEFTFALELVSPCSGWLVEGGARNAITYSVVDGALRYTGLSGGGYRRGSEAIVCRSGVYILDAAGICTYWQERAGLWSKTPGECGFKPDAKGVEGFLVKHEGINERFRIEGDSLVPSGLTTQKVTDYATAKALVDAKRSHR
jgi:hypothetical protein